jgi:hypothetical protein
MYEASIGRVGIIYLHIVVVHCVVSLLACHTKELNLNFVHQSYVPTRYFISPNVGIIQINQT